MPGWSLKFTTLSSPFIRSPYNLKGVFIIEQIKEMNQKLFEQTIRSKINSYY